MTRVAPTRTVIITLPYLLLDAHDMDVFMRNQPLTDQPIVVLDATSLNDISIRACDELVRLLFRNYRHQPDKVVLVTSSYHQKMLFGTCMEGRGEFAKLSVLEKLPTMDEVNALAAEVTKS